MTKGLIPPILDYMLPLEERIIRDFEELRIKKPLHGDHLIFRSLIRGKGLKFNSLKMLFEKLVDKRDYSKEDLEEILKDDYKATLIGWD